MLNLCLGLVLPAGVDATCCARCYRYAEQNDSPENLPLTQKRNIRQKQLYIELLKQYWAVRAAAIAPYRD